MEVFKSAVISGFKNWNNFSGRATRSEFWYLLLSMYILVFLLALIVGEASGIVRLIFLVPLIAAAIRRMHDMGRSGWWSIVPIVNMVFACTQSDPSINKYGPPRPPVG